MIKLERNIEYNGDITLICPKCGNIVSVSKVNASVSYLPFGKDEVYRELPDHLKENWRDDKIEDYIHSNPVSYHMVDYADIYNRAIPVVENTLPVYCHCTGRPTIMKVAGGSYRTLIGLIQLGYDVLTYDAKMDDDMDFYCGFKIKLGPMNMRHYVFLKYMIANHNRFYIKDKYSIEVDGIVEYDLRAGLPSTIASYKDSDLYYFKTKSRCILDQEQQPLPDDFDKEYESLLNENGEIKEDVVKILVEEFKTDNLGFSQAFSGDYRHLI